MRPVQNSSETGSISQQPIIWGTQPVVDPKETGAMMDVHDDQMLTQSGKPCPRLTAPPGIDAARALNSIHTVGALRF
jgi:hypothetical protein